MHFIATSACGLNLVERFFRDNSENHIKRDSFAGMVDLEPAIAQRIEHHKRDPRPLNWTASAHHIVA
jgi:hypothetical protein